jgi:hypothetical protein
MSHDTADDFRSVAWRKLRAVTEVYDSLPVRPELPGNEKAMAQCHATARSVLGHIALLRKLLGLDKVDAADAADGIDLDLDTYRRMVARLDEVVGD